jgi:concanavalin A-like lectin/glucanase superfamily protein
VGSVLLVTPAVAPAAGAAAAPHIQVVRAHADAYVSARSPRGDYHRRPRLQVRSRPVKRAFLRFDVSGLTGRVTKATLRLRAVRSSRVGYDVRAVASRAWPRGGLTYRVAPKAGGRIGSSGPFAAGKWVVVDVTRAVHGNGVVTLALTARSSALVLLASREAGPRSAPRLVITSAPATVITSPDITTPLPPRGDEAPVLPPPPPEATETPEVTGRAWEKRALAASPGSWTGTLGAYSYQWRRCDKTGGSCEDVPDATDPEYTVHAKDIGGTIRVAVTASNDGGSTTATSGPTAVVTRAPALPTFTSAPSISGRAQEGLSLTLRPGKWRSAEPVEWDYQWQRCDTKGARCADVDQAVMATYGVTSADLGSTLRVAVTASNVAGSTTVTTKPTPTVTVPPPPPSAGVVGLWHMDELSGTTMIDSSSAGNHGKLKDVLLNQPGYIGTGYYFNGNSAIVTINSANSLNPGLRDFSWGLNLRFTSKPSGSVDTWDPMRKGYSDTDGGDFKMEIFPSGEPTCYIQGDLGSARVTGNRDLADGIWHTVTCSRRGGSVRLEVDGKSYSSSADVGSISNSAPLVIGARTSSMEFFKGFIDEAHMVIE